MTKPRAGFCWACSKKLWAGLHVEKEVDGHVRILHKRCAKRIEEDHELDPVACPPTCPGCACHLNPPCYHCTEGHMTDED